MLQYTPSQADEAPNRAAFTQDELQERVNELMEYGQSCYPKSASNLDEAYSEFSMVDQLRIAAFIADSQFEKAGMMWQALSHEYWRKVAEGKAESQLVEKFFS